MFTGIIEALGEVREISSAGTNKSFWLKSPISAEFKIDQSIAHNGVCLTIEDIQGPLYRVTAVEETLEKTNLGQWFSGTFINLERSMLPSQRVDGHFVQGHVDTTAKCTGIKDRHGSYEFEFRFPKKFAPLVIEKGSVCINGISLTAFDVKKNSFRVAIIPYTFEHTNMQFLKEDELVNLEFDMIGKYILRKLSLDK
jgi:riboflavin synthase